MTWLCILFGHKWELLAFTDERICLRCHTVQRTDGVQTALDQLGVQIHRLRRLNRRGR